MTVTVDRQGEKKVLMLRPETATELKIGMSGLIPDMPAEIGRLKPGFPAEKAGLMVNDKIIAVDGKDDLSLEPVFLAREGEQGGEAHAHDRARRQTHGESHYRRSRTADDT